MDSRYRRFIRGKLDHEALDLIAAHLHAYAIYDGVALRFRGFSSSLEVGAELNWIETRRHPIFDALVDLALAELVAAFPRYAAYCSDCYAHFTDPPKPWRVQPSQSCARTQLSGRSVHVREGA